MLVHIVVERFAADLLNDVAHNLGSEVVIHVGGSRLTHDWREIGEHRLFKRKRFGGRIIQNAGRRGVSYLKARRMGQQHLHRNRLAERILDFVAAEILLNVVLKPDLSLVDKLHQCDDRKHLGH
ncbi:hypothetical protein D3C71_1714830 [compost metagenome]